MGSGIQNRILKSATYGIRNQRIHRHGIRNPRLLHGANLCEISKFFGENCCIDFLTLLIVSIYMVLMHEIHAFELRIERNSQRMIPAVLSAA